MEQAMAVLSQLLVLWIVLTGLVWMVRGPQGALAMNRWAARGLWRLTRHTVGGIFLWIGRMIRGQEGGGQRDRRRH